VEELGDGAAVEHALTGQLWQGRFHYVPKLAKQPVFALV
jgi:hypothetical protein